MSWVTWRNFSLARVVAWSLLTPISFLTGWVRSVTFVSLLSLWALVESALAAWRADVPNR